MFSIDRMSERKNLKICWNDTVIMHVDYGVRLGLVFILVNINDAFKKYVNKHNKIAFFDILKEEVDIYKNSDWVSGIFIMILGDTEKRYKKEMIEYIGLETCVSDRYMIQTFMEKKFRKENYKMVCGNIFFNKDERKKEKQFLENINKSLENLRKNKYVNWEMDKDHHSIDLYFYRSKYRNLEFKKTENGFHLEMSKEAEVIQGTDEETITNALKKMMDRIQVKERLKYVVANDNVSYLFQEVAKTMDKKIQDELWYEMRKTYSFEELEGFVIEYLDKGEQWKPLLDFENCVVIKAGETYHAWAGKGKTFTEESREKIIKKVVTYKEKLYLEKMK